MTKKEFFRILKEKNAYISFIDNFNSSSSFNWREINFRNRNTKDINVYLKYSKKNNYTPLTNAFLWKGTKEGHFSGVKSMSFARNMKE